MLFYGKKAIPRSTNVEFVLLNIFDSIETYLNSSSLKPINPFKRNVPCMVLYNIYVFVWMEKCRKRFLWEITKLISLKLCMNNHRILL